MLSAYGSTIPRHDHDRRDMRFMILYRVLPGLFIVGAIVALYALATEGVGGMFWFGVVLFLPEIVSQIFSLAPLKRKGE